MPSALASTPPSSPWSPLALTGVALLHAVVALAWAVQRSPTPPRAVPVAWVLTLEPAAEAARAEHAAAPSPRAAPARSTPAQRPLPLAPAPSLLASATPAPTALPVLAPQAATSGQGGAPAPTLAEGDARALAERVPGAASAEAVTAPRFDANYLQNPAPAYPPLSRKAREQGTVTLRVQVDEQGQAREVRVQASSGHERLDRAALAAVSRWTFVPARQGTRTVSAWVLVPLIFALKD